MDKYEEALEKARVEYEKARKQGYTWLMNLLEGMFPEVKESEDERIRKEIIHYILYKADGVSEKQEHEWVAWLEKQKELPTNDEMLRTLRTEYEKGVADTIAKYEQEEQKPDFIIPKRIRPKFAVGDTVCRPMWSDHTIREIYIDCNDPVYVCVNDEGLESHISFSEQDEWERKEQKPAVWSEEDERMRNQLVYDVEYHKKEGLVSAKKNKATEALYNGIEKCYDEKIAWLKSLRPQPQNKPYEHWQPCDEHFRALGYAIEYFKKKENDTTHLEDLYNGLKKLS